MGVVFSGQVVVISCLIIFMIWQVNVLDKSRSDWKDLKKGNQGLEEELETHKKSNDQYLDKVNFLHRASVKEHEKERDERLASDVRTRGRL